MKKYLAIILVAVMFALSLSGCRNKENEAEESVTMPQRTPITTESNSSEDTEDTIEGEETDANEPEAELDENEGQEEEAHMAEGGNKSGAAALAALLSGNNAYLSGDINPDISDSRRNDLFENGQKPYAIIITCADSRVPAELIFNAGLGDIFVIRTAGNVVSDFEIGSVEYGAEHLGSPLVMVLGHTNCGAVTAAAEGGEAGGKIKSIVEEIAPSVKKASESTSGEEALLSKAIELNVQNSINRLRESDIINELEHEHKLDVIGAVYDIHTGQIKVL